MRRDALSVSVKISLISLFLILSVGSVFLFILLPRWVRGRVVEVPNVSGRSLAEARRAIEGIGLRAVVSGRRFSNLVPEGHVIDQSPKAGMRTKLGNKVCLIVSLGRDKVNVPDLIGLTPDEAERRLATFDLQVGLRDTVYSERPPGTIIAQSPLPGSVAARGDRVDLLISEGVYPEPMVMNDLRGMKLDEAERLIRGSGLKVGEVRFKEVRDRPPGTVLDHSPPPGEIVKVGDRVDLTVSASGGGGDRG